MEACSLLDDPLIRQIFIVNHAYFHESKGEITGKRKIKLFKHILHNIVFLSTIVNQGW